MKTDSRTDGSNRVFYIFHRQQDKPGEIFSLSPDHSDSLENQTILNSLVGTLVKYGPSGRVEPYLAESWVTSAEGRVWNFQLRKNLRCEDGSEITSEAYVQKLRTQLKKYSKRGKVVTFDLLKGWGDFILTGNATSLGVRAESGNRLIFEFEKEPQDFLEFLRMVYFGYWCDGNFVDGNFSSNDIFISSGAYRLVVNEKGRRIVIRRRPDWPTLSPDSIEEIEFSARVIEGKVGSHDKTVARLGVSVPDLSDADQFHKVRTEPVVLAAYILTPWSKSGFFADVRNRKVFQSRLAQDQLPANLPELGIYPSKFFYQNAHSDLPAAELEHSSYLPLHGEIHVALPARLGKLANEVVKGQVLRLLEGVPSEKIRIESVDSGDPLLRKSLISNKHYDIRVTSVDIGGSFVNAFIDMMFCTPLGVSFPDPNGKICALVNEYKAHSNEIDTNYIFRFNRILNEEAYVLPLFHSGLTILYSKDFDTNSIPAGANHPRFEDFRFNAQ